MLYVVLISMGSIHAFDTSTEAENPALNEYLLSRIMIIVIDAIEGLCNDLWYYCVMVCTCADTCVYGQTERHP